MVAVECEASDGVAAACTSTSGRSGNGYGALASALDRASALLEAEGELLAAYERALRRQRVVTCAACYMEDFRLHVYWDLTARDPSLAQRFPTPDDLTEALRTENCRYRAGRMQERPLMQAFSQGLARLGMEPDEWCQLLEAIGGHRPRSDNYGCRTDRGGVSTLGELQGLAFPPEMEACRPVLLKVARRVHEMEAEAEQRRRPPAQAAQPDPLDELDLF